MNNKWGDFPDWMFNAAGALLQSLKTADSPTFYHCLRVGEMARLLAKDAGLNEYEQKLAHYSGMFHDIGKIGIPKEILAKPTRLTDEEYKIMKNHSIMSESILSPLQQKTQFVGDLLPSVRGHHERIDGSGYPDKLMDEQIPLVARIILIVDTVDAMRNNRAYRLGLPIEKVYAELKKFSGTQFDAQLVKTFLDVHPTWGAIEIEEETKFKVLKIAA